MVYYNKELSDIVKQVGQKLHIKDIRVSQDKNWFYIHVYDKKFEYDSKIIRTMDSMNLREWIRLNRMKK